MDFFYRFDYVCKNTIYSFYRYYLIIVNNFLLESWKIVFLFFPKKRNCLFAKLLSVIMLNGSFRIAFVGKYRNFEGLYTKA